MSPAKAKRSTKVDELKPICPCCGKARSVRAMSRFLGVVRTDYKKHGGEFDQYAINLHIERANAEWFVWACDFCLDQGKALAGKPWLQVYGLAAPFYIYCDVRRRCSDCNNKFIFSAKEQQYWYETLKFIIYSSPQQCLTCRRKRRGVKAANKALTAAIAALSDSINAQDPAQLAELSELYIKVGSYIKALEFYRRAKNKLKRNNPSNALLAKMEELRTQIESMQAAEK
jgi:hypothetical protein